MTTSASTTFSPSRRSTTRSTPCVLGCCGPMFSTSSLVSNIAPWTAPGLSSALPVLLNLGLFLRLTELQPVDRILHQQLAGSFERIVLALRESLPVLRHQNAAAVGMAREIDAEHVPDFALEPVRRRPQSGHRRYRIVFADDRLHPDAVAVHRRIQDVDDVDAPFFPRDRKSTRLHSSH